MNPSSIRRFLTSRLGLFVIFLVVLFTGLAVYGRYQRDRRATARLDRPSASTIGQMRANLDRGLEDRIPQPATAAGAGTALIPLEQPKPAPARAEKPERPRKIHIAPLLAAYDPAPTRPEPRPTVIQRIVPFGTLLKCKLVNTVDSADLDTPIIAALLEDVWQNGNLVLPANTLVHGTAKTGRTRDRIAVGSTWRLVWQDGRELPFTGLALDREYDHDINGYGITDGSAGLRGDVLATDGLQDLKVLASAALSGFARGTQDRTQTAYGSTITGSVNTGLREGLGEVFDVYARRTLRDVEDNGYFVRVPAGKEFYVYLLRAIDPTQARFGSGPTSAAQSIPAALSEIGRPSEKP